MILNRRYLVASAVALLTSAIAFYLATGLHPSWWLLWLAPIPVLLLAARVSWRIAFSTAFVSYALGGLNLWNYFHRLLSTPVPVILLIIGLPAILFAVDVLLFRWMLRRSLWRSALLFPSFWVGCEFVNAVTSPHGTAGNLAYTQMNFLPVLQVASLTGIWSISFCVFFFAASSAIILGTHGTATARRKLAITVALVLIGVLGFGIWRLHAKTTTRSVEVALLASDLKQNILTDDPADTLRLLREYSSRAETLAQEGARVVVIPEKIAVVPDSILPEADALLRSTAEKSGALLVVGVIHPTGTARWNEARLYFPDGSIRTYEKHHMLPVYEGDLTPGTDRTEWQVPAGLLGIAICKDMDFPQLSRDYGKDGVGLLLVPAWDFGVDGWWHGRMAILRGVESGFSIARAPKQGILAVSDNRGRVLAETSSGSAPFASLIVAVPVQSEATFYDRFGNWFGWANLFLLAALLLSALRVQRASPKPARMSFP
jgi:apolipoprotein N-acyltransferase